MLREDKARYEKLKQKQNRTEEEDEALIDLYQGIGEIEGALLEMADVDGLDDPYEAFDYFEDDPLFASLDEEGPFTPEMVQMGSFVLLKDNSIYQVLYNHEGGYSLYNHNYACLSYLDEYSEDFSHPRTSAFSIQKVLSKDAYEDDYKRVAVSFISGSRLLQKTIDSISWTWEREEDLSLNPNPVTM